MKILKKLGIAGAWFVAATASAQNYHIDLFTIGGGGGTSTGGVYAVSGTIGQPEASGPTAGGNFSLTGGFWSLLEVVPPGAPRLRITLTRTNTAIISWPSPSAGFVLQQSANLTTLNWVAPAEPINNDGTNKFIIVNPPTGIRFYRLSTP